MGEIFHREARAGRPDRHRGIGPPNLPPPLPVLTPEIPSGARGEGVYGRVAMAGVGPWSPSINDVPHPFPQIGLCFDGGEGEMGDAALLGI